MADAAKAVLAGRLVSAALTRRHVQAASALILSQRVRRVPKGRTVDASSACRAPTAADVAGAMQTVLEAVGAGRLTPEEGAQVAALLETRRRTIETAELAALLNGLEQQRR